MKPDRSLHFVLLVVTLKYRWEDGVINKCSVNFKQTLNMAGHTIQGQTLRRQHRLVLVWIAALWFKVLPPHIYYEKFIAKIHS